MAREPRRRRARIALVFLSTEGVSWPDPHYDVRTREKEILGLLNDGCTEIEFISMAVREPSDVDKAVAMRDQIDGYLVYCVTLAWKLKGALITIGKLGKPMLVADEFLGGSGLFLMDYALLLRQGIPATGVATTRPSDLVTVARCFAELKPDTTQATFAAQCEQAYRRTFGAVGKLKCADDPLTLADTRTCAERFKNYRFLIVDDRKPGQEEDFLGAKGIHVGFAELKTVCDRVDRDQAAEWADRWAAAADKVVEPSAESLRKAGVIHLGILELLKKYGSDTVTMNCLGGFNHGKLPAYPCLGFMELLDDGRQGVCQAMPNDTLSMLMARILTGRPGYVSNPVLDTSKNRIVYSHCMATTRVFGPEGKANPFRIRTLHNRDPRGACVQSLLPGGYMTTSLRTDFARKRMVIHQAKAVESLDTERGCRTQLVGEVRGDIGKLFRQWDAFTWHRVTVYGDVKEPLIEFGKALGLSIVEEA